MAQTGTPRPAGSEQSLGELVAQASKDVSLLIRGELNLAKVELKQDLSRVVVAVVLLALSGFVACLMLVLLCFAFAFGLVALGISDLGGVPHRRRRLPAAHRPGRADRHPEGARRDGPEDDADIGAGDDDGAARQRRPAPGNRRPGPAVSAPR